MTGPVPPGAPRPRPPMTSSRAGRNPAVRAIALMVGGVLAACLVGVGALATANVLVRTTERDARTFTGPVERVVVNVTGTLTVRPGAEQGAVLTRRSTFGLSRPEVVETLEDGVLTVRVRCRQWLVVCDNRVTLEVPPAASVSARAFDLSVRDMEGPVTVDGGSGDVELRRLSGPVEADIGSGAIVASDLRSTEVRASAGAGAVELGFAVPPVLVEASVGAGHVGVTVPPGDEAYDVDASTGTGSPEVSVRTDPDSERTIRVRSGAGATEVRYSSG